MRTAAFRRTTAVTLAAVGLAMIGGQTAPPASAAMACPVVVDGAVIPFPESGTAVDCSGKNLSGADLRGADLTGWRMELTNLSGADLSGATLRGADLFAADLSGATLDDADLSYSFLRWTSFEHAALGGAQLAGAVLGGTRVGGATLTTASLSGVVTGTVVVDADTLLPAGWQVRSGYLLGPGVVYEAQSDLRASDLSGVDLTGARLSSSDLSYANLSGAALAGADLSGANLWAANFVGATGMASVVASSSTDWTDATCPAGEVAQKHDGRACNRTLDLTAPTATPPAPAPFATSIGAWIKGGFADGGSGVWGHRMMWRTSRSGTTTWSTWKVGSWEQTSSNLVAAMGSPGLRTCMRFQVRDYAGNVSAWSVERCVDTVTDSTGGGVLPDDHWVFASSQAYFDWSLESTKTYGAKIVSDRPLYVRQLGVLATTCSTCGAVSLYVGGTKVGTLNLARSVTTARSLLLLPRTAMRLYGTVTLRVVSATGKLVRVDALAITGY